ncbi:3-hydroxyisobutyrate dehydrogenase [Altererythrobacter atlanticus]|uniref:2-(Hydroxymethyl)glutarate dehydrogenase n=2 Tax=Croceibacterium atlanticum TaxID=1267766 RepID=A0A0F7KTF8_9SPHN|nr:2-(hydroxymethyl)glutarate dehydrogenase [Croceibacterium atlanticum]MBB5731198.1 3-hydroxyisobutyrate dehydrogenase [Croceibacterium atlanticum]
MTDAKSIAFLGMGVMGAPMAGHLACAGHRVTIYNRTLSRAHDWMARHGEEGLAVSMAETPAEAASGKEVVITCVGNDHDLAEVVLGDAGVLSVMTAGSLFIDHTTVSPAIARSIAQDAAKHGILALDAPISGGQAGAENGKLSVMCGGSEEAMAAARPVIEAYGSRITHIGAAGCGQAAKAVNQICIAGTLAGLSEGVRFAQATGLDMDKVLQAISGGAAQSWQMENRWATMAAGEFDFGFAIDWMRKDLGIALGEAKENGVPLPVTALVDQFYAMVQAMGGNRQDTSALIRHLPEGSGK